MAEVDVTGDRSERDAVLRRLLPTLRRYLGRYCRDPGTAEDLVQETLLRIARALPGFRGQARLETWALAIASRTAADHYRRVGRAIETVPAEAEAVADAGTQASSEERLVVDEMNACVREVIEALAPDHRAALILRDMEGYSTAETAAMLDCTEASVKIRLHRARARLRAALGQQCEFYRDREAVFRCARKPAR